MKTGKIEILASSVEVLGECASILPFEINRSREEASEETRLKYRYLDLRNPKVHDNMVFRFKVIDYIRSLMKSMNIHYTKQKLLKEKILFQLDLIVYMETQV